MIDVPIKAIKSSIYTSIYTSIDKNLIFQGLMRYLIIKID